MSGKKPLCGDCEDGWLTDEDGRIIERCPCRYEQITPAAARDDGIAGAVEANPQAMKAALAIIIDAAKTSPVLSGNDVRAAMKIAQVPGPVVGAAFRQAVKDHVLRPIGYVPSLDAATHAHPIREYESRIYGRLGRTAS